MKRSTRAFEKLVLNLLDTYQQLTSIRLKLMVFLYDIYHTQRYDQPYTHIRYVKGIYGFLHSVTANDFEKALQKLLDKRKIARTQLRDTGLWTAYKAVEKPSEQIDVSFLEPVAKHDLNKLLNGICRFTEALEYGEFILADQSFSRLNFSAVAAILNSKLFNSVWT